MLTVFGNLQTTTRDGATLTYAVSLDMERVALIARGIRINGLKRKESRRGPLRIKLLAVSEPQKEQSNA